MNDNSHNVSLDSLQLNQRAFVNSFSDELIEEKMLEMGCLPGSLLTVEKFAPLGDPIMIKVEGSHIALRKDEAKHILVTVEQ